MIRKFATVPGYRVVLTLIWMTILAGATTVHAQQTPAQPASGAAAAARPAQQPDNQPVQQSGSFARRVDARAQAQSQGLQELGHSTWAAERVSPAERPEFCARRRRRRQPLASLATTTSISDSALDFQLDNLPLRDSALQLAQAPSATSHVYTLMLGPIINHSASPRAGADTLWAELVFFIDPANSIPRPPFRDRPATLSSIGGELASTPAFP